MIICSSMLSRLRTGMEQTGLWATGLPDIAWVICDFWISGLFDSTAILAMGLRSSRTLPGQDWESSAETASGTKTLPGLLRLR